MLAFSSISTLLTKPDEKEQGMLNRRSAILGLLSLSATGFLLTGMLNANAAADPPGKYAVFKTSLGTFKVHLFDKEAPKTVANFEGLATGTKEWTDPKSGMKVKKPFYNGLIFHRVIDGFMIQGGCPLGNGMGDPGYKFKDEFSPKLRHSKEGMLSMANSGKDTNGSQFFVTLGPTPHLDDRHSIFGEVVSGMDVVHKIGSTPVKSDPSQGIDHRPVKAVVLQTVTIENVK